MFIFTLLMLYIIGSAADFTDSFPISPRQPLRKKLSKIDVSGEIPIKTENEENDSNTSSNIRNTQDNDKNKVPAQPSPERQHRNSRSYIDRAKPRKSPCRPLPGIKFKISL